MYLNLEAGEKHSIQGYSEQEITVDSQTYQQSLIISSQEIISDWPVKTILELNEETINPLLRYNPKIILIGHNQSGQFPPLSLVHTFLQQQIGFECMSIGAACRTYNVLLSELREVVVGIIL